jgi:hypothetical protein
MPTPATEAKPVQSRNNPDTPPQKNKEWEAAKVEAKRKAIADAARAADAERAAALARAQQRSVRTGLDGVREVTAPVKVERDGIAVVAEATSVLKGGVLSVTPYELKATPTGLSHETSAAVIAGSSGVPGDATRVRWGFTDNSGQEGATSTSGPAHWLSQQLRNVGLSKAFIGLQADVLAGLGEIKGTMKWNTGKAKVDINAVTAAVNFRALASANVDTPEIAGLPSLRTSVALYGGAGGEWKSQTKSRGETFARAGVNGAVALTDQKDAVREMLTPKQRAAIGIDGQEAPQEERFEVMPNGKKVDVNSVEGSEAEGKAFIAVGSNAENFHIQKSHNGMSNVSLTVGNFTTVDDEGEIKIPQTVDNAHGYGRRAAVKQVFIDSGTGDVTRVKINGQTFLTTEAVTKWLNEKGKQAEMNGDNTLARLKTITPEELVDANPSLVRTEKIRGPLGDEIEVQLFSVGDTINIASATVEGEKGLMKATNLINGSTKAEKKEVKNQMLRAVADVVEPTAIQEDGRVNIKRLAASGGAKLVNAIGEGAPRALGGFVDSTLDKVASAISPDRRNVAQQVRDGAQNLKDNPFVGEAANEFVSEHVGSLKILDQAESFVRNNVLPGLSPALALASIPQINKALTAGLNNIGNAAVAAGDGVGNFYADSRMLGGGVEYMRWYSLHGQTAENQAMTTVSQAQQNIVSKLEQGDISQRDAALVMATAYREADALMSASHQYADDGLRTDLEKGTLFALAEQNGQTVDAYVTNLAAEQVIALQEQATQRVASRKTESNRG